MLKWMNESIADSCVNFHFGLKFLVILFLYVYVGRLNTPQNAQQF